MRKLFGNKRNAYEDDIEREDLDEDLEYEGFDDYAEDGEYDGDETEYSDEYYESDGEYSDEEVYEDNPEYVSGDEYYGDEASYEGEEVYGDDGTYEGEAVYGDDGIYGDETVYEDQETYEDGEIYESEEYYGDEYEYAESEESDLEFEDDEEDEEDDGEQRGGIWQKILNMSLMDRIITTTGVAVLILALVTGAIYYSANMAGQQVSSFGSVGEQLAGITLIGEQGLTAVADAEMARIDAANALEEAEKENKDYEEAEYVKEVTVVMNMTSIQKDLKVKFVNKQTKKLIANVPFSVEVTTPDGKTETWTDDDMDGIIYKKGIDGGNYKVAMLSLEDEKYKDYKISTDSKKIEVKDKIAYEKVDVADEIKEESEINAKEEDTAQNDVVVESELKDTVTWVESTQSTAYVAVPKSEIKDPATASLKNRFYRLAGEVLISGVTEAAAGATVNLTAVPAADFETWTVSGATWSSKNPEIASVGADGTVTVAGDVAEDTTVTIIYKCTLTNTVVSGGDEVTLETREAEATHTIQIAAAKPQVSEVTVTPAALTLDLSAGKSTGELTVNVTAEEGVSKDVTWSSDNEAVATVGEDDGIVKAVSAGTAIITATSVADSTKSGSCVVTVTGTPITMLKIDKETATLPEKETLKLTATTTPAGGAVTWTSDKTDIATVAEDGTVTGVKEGEAVITATAIAADGSKLTAKCTVTVTKLMKLEATTATVLVGGETQVKVQLTDEGKGTLKAFSADTNALVVEIKDKTVVLKGVAAKNSVGVTVAYTTPKGEVVSQDIMVNVISDSNKLKDKDGSQLYVLGADGKYTEAVSTDYYKYDTFYLKTEKYTGWQTIGGNVYFYDINGKYVTGEQVIQGAKYNFASDGSLITGNGTFGIDVSKWNGTIDWNAVKNSGVSYVIIRCGYRGSSKGSLVVDPKFKTNIKGATAAGLKVGVYFFTQAVDEAEAVEEASMVLELIKDYKISYPVFLDVESSGGRGDKIDSDTRTKVIQAFCKTIESKGYTAGVYANKTWLESKMDVTQLTKYKIWLAQYAQAPTYTKSKIDLWQYKSTGKVSGISGNVDLNLSYLGY